MFNINSFNKSILDDPAIRKIIEKLANVTITGAYEIPKNSVIIGYEHIWSSD